MKFSIAIEKLAFDDLMANLTPEYRKDSKGRQVEKSKKLTGTWIKPFQKKIEEFEGTDLSLKGNDVDY